MLGLRCCARALSSCGERGPLFIAVRGPLTIAASLVAEHRLQTRRLSSCGSRGQLLRGMWDLPRPGLEPVSPALAGRLSATAPPGKPESWIFKKITWAPEEKGGQNQGTWGSFPPPLLNIIVFHVHLKFNCSCTLSLPAGYTEATSLLLWDSSPGCITGLQSGTNRQA